MAGIAIFQSGLPFSVITTSPYPRRDYNADDFNYDSPNTPTFGNHVSVARSAYINGLFTAPAFPAPGPGQEGNLGRNTFTGPGLANVNLNVIKTARIPWFVKEGATFQRMSSHGERNKGLPGRSGRGQLVVYRVRSFVRPALHTGDRELRRLHEAAR